MPMNYRCIQCDLVEARDQLDKIIAKFDAGEEMPEADYLVMIRHAFHHLNVAWNARRSSPAAYRNMSGKRFRRWRNFPCGKEWDEMHRRRVPGRQRQNPS